MGGSVPGKGASQAKSRPLRLGAQQTELAGGGGFSAPVPPLGLGRSVWEKNQIWGSCGGTERTGLGDGIRATARTRHPRTLTCARCLGCLRLSGLLRCAAAAGICSQVRLPRPQPRPAGAPCLSSGRRGAPDAAAGGGAARPAPPERRGGGGRRGDARGGGGRVAAPKTRRGSGHWLGAGGRGGSLFPALTSTHAPQTWKRERVSVASDV